MNNLEKLIAALLKFKTSESDEKRQSSISSNYFSRRKTKKNKLPVIFSNDLNPQHALVALDTAQPLLPISPDKPTVSMVIGEGYFIDSAPSYIKHCNLVIFIDKDPLVLKHNAYLIRLIKQVNSPQEFINHYIGDSSNNPALKDMPTEIEIDKVDSYTRTTIKMPTVKALVAMLEQRTRQEQLYNYAFLSSEQRFMECKKAVEQLNIVYVETDFAIIENARALAKILQEHAATITTLQLTNLYEYDGNFPLNQLQKQYISWKSNGELEKTLHALHGTSDNVHVLYSCLNGESGYTTLTCRFSSTLSGYLKDNENNAQLMNQAWKSNRSYYGPTAQDVITHFTWLIKKYENNPTKRATYESDLTNAQKNLSSSPYKRP